MIKVIKRDGTFADFDVNYIIHAIIKAMNEVGVPDSGWAVNTALEIQSIIFAEASSVTVKDIQTYVEDALMKAHPDVARAYIDYRARRDKAREEGSQLHNQIMGLINRTDENTLNENSNKDSRVLHTQRDLLAGLVCKHYGLNHILPKHVAQGHKDGTIHYHDLDYSPFFQITNCCLVDLKFMFDNGFKMGAAEIETPNSITTAAAIAAQIVAQVASSQYGGTTLGDIDIVLAPYVKKTYDKHYEIACDWGIPMCNDYAMEATIRDVDSAMQGLLYEVNTLHTSNGQSPFVTFGFGLGDTWEAKLIQEGILKQQLKGLGKKGITPVFPKLVYAVKVGHNFNPEDPFYSVKKLAVECAAKRMYPDFLSYKNNRMITGADKITYPMGCRSFLGGWQDPNTGEYVTHGRNNLGVVSLNLPRIVLECGGDVEQFWKLLDERLVLCKDALDTRLDSLRNTKASVAPILYTEGAFGVKLDPNDSIMKLFEDGRSSISLGYIGIHEMLQGIFGTEVHPYENEAAKEFAIKVVQYLRDAVELWKKETGFGYSLYSTPSESLCDRFCRLDTAKFGVVAGITDKGYYTNSFHLDVLKKVSPFEKFKFETEFHKIASGGHISYAEYPDMKQNLEALESALDYAMVHGDYFGTNTPSDECFECGYDGEFTATSKGYHCPRCGNNNPETVSVTRRTCGYLGRVDSIPYILGKQLEVINRVKHV